MLRNPSLKLIEMYPKSKDKDPTNFIKNIINDDLENKRHTYI